MSLFILFSIYCMIERIVNNQTQLTVVWSMKSSISMFQKEINNLMTSVNLNQIHEDSNMLYN